jgi:ATP-dependent helicase/nuclease subunit A
VNEEHKPLHPLIPAQMAAVEPRDNIWLSASAGTGKTQVLTARVIRLLLEDNVNPENLLCITFTKAGAAEMAERINGLLASWVQMEDHTIFADLEAIGAVSGHEERKRASQLFAKVLDAPGGGLQIMTIHSLCQSLLGSFPEEAGLIPGFKPVEGREQQELYSEALSEMIVTAEDSGDDWILKNLQSLSLAMGEEAAFKFLIRCASQPIVMTQIPNDAGAIVYARHLVGLDFEGPVSAMMEMACADGVIARQSLIAIAEMNEKWATKTGLERALKVREWLALSPPARAAGFDKLHSVWSTQKNEIAKVVPKDDSYLPIAVEMFQWSLKLIEHIKLADYAERLSKALLAGKAFSARYAAAKTARGLIDFDDMIRRTAALLNTGGMADWVRYKLDRQIDHILVDEAQDTNMAQWDIIKALSDDFFSGASAKGDKVRTIFSVGDFKQAIFGFQGTDPAKYAQAGKEFADRISTTEVELQGLELSQSFRSTKPVLDFVNAVIAQVGPERFGLTKEIPDHYSAKADAGMIELFTPVLPINEDKDSDTGDDDESWLTKEKAILAHRIAAYVRRLLDDKPVLASTGKPLAASDIMILLRSRSDLAASIVGRLHAVNVPVAGIDRLRLQEPVGVQDMLAAVRFVLQPGDDLSLACLLVSPLFGWSQDQLLKYGYREPGAGLWQHLRGQSEIAADIEQLRAILASADFTTAYQFFETILSGSQQGRKKMTARLGEESLVPIEELLNAALQFQQSHGGGLQAFLAWFESSNDEIKREGISGNNEVRVMTVHGSKGLQAPVVILADVTSDPKKKPSGSSELSLDDGGRLPMLTIRSAEKIGRLAEAAELQEERELAEHSRLLYVAMTRAEERLVMAGALGKRSKGEAAEHSWYPVLQAGMEALGCTWQEEQPWGHVMRYHGAEQPQPDTKVKANPANTEIQKLPEWLLTDAPEENRPPRPLIPSHLDDDDYGDAPPSQAMQAAAEKGRLIHAIFERLPGGDIEAALAQAVLWLERNNRDTSISNEDIITSVRHVAVNSNFADFFGSNARAEVPLAAVVGEKVIAGRVDRLVIEPGRVRVLDFKTGRGVPKDTTSLPTAYLRQMAHYVAALEVIFPGSQVEASLLFTHNATLMALSDDVLAPHKPTSTAP